MMSPKKNKQLNGYMQLHGSKNYLYTYIYTQYTYNIHTFTQHIQSNIYYSLDNLDGPSVRLDKIPFYFWFRRII